MNEKKIISGKELFKRLNDESWENLIPRLQYYSLNKLQRFPFLKEMYNINNLAVHFSDEAIKQVWLEERTWNVNYYKDLYSLLKGIVDSQISNFLASKEIEITSAITEYEEDFIESRTMDPETQLIFNEIEEEINLILVSDPDANNVFQCLRDGLKPREISKDLKIDINDIYNILKRIDRKLKDVKIKLKS